MTSFAQELRNASELLLQHGIESAAGDARWMLAAASGIKRDRLTLHLSEPLDEQTAFLFWQMVLERKGRVPMSHILGGRDFYGRWFKVTPDVLDPRPETEVLVQEALKHPFNRVLDLGVGSGCILVTLLAERPQAKGVGVDISGEAVLVAGENAARHGVQDRIVLPMSDWWEDTGGHYDMIVANPPYISSDEMADLAPELDHEPRLALTDGADGLEAYRKIAAGLTQHLTPGGHVLLEIGPTQADAVTELLLAGGLEDISVLPDLDGRDRVVCGRFSS